MLYGAISADFILGKKESFPLDSGSRVERFHCDQITMCLRWSFSIRIFTDDKFSAVFAMLKLYSSIWFVVKILVYV